MPKFKGRFIFPDGQPYSGARLKVYRLSVKGEKTLNLDIRQTSGRKDVNFAIPNFPFEAGVDYQLRVFTHQGEELARSGLLNSNMEFLTLVLNDQEEIGDSVFIQLKNQLDPLLEGQDLAEIPENTYDYLAKKTGLTEASIIQYIQSLVLAEKIGQKNRPEVAYALQRVGLMTGFELNPDVFRDEQRLLDIVRDADQRNIIPSRKDSFNQTQFRRRKKEFIEQDFPQLPEYQWLDTLLESNKGNIANYANKRNKFFNILFEEQKLTKGFWEGVSKGRNRLKPGEAELLQTHVKLAEFFKFHMPMVEVLGTVIRQSADFPSMVWKPKEEWIDHIKEAGDIPDYIPNPGNPEQHIDHFANYIDRELAQLFPTAYLGRILDNKTFPPELITDPTQSPHFHPNEFIKFLKSDFPEFDFRKDRVQTFWKEHNLDPTDSLLPELRVWQRLFDIAPIENPHMVVLKLRYDLNINSIFQLTRITQEQFERFWRESFFLWQEREKLELLEQHLALLEAVLNFIASGIYRKAQRKNNAINLLLGRIHRPLAGLKPEFVPTVINQKLKNSFSELKVLPEEVELLVEGQVPQIPLSPQSIANLQAQGINIANSATWRDLFGTIDYCNCEHCRSLYSPAAYFVDLLEWMPTSAKDLLFQRRPDLKHIKLSCENTNTPLPYIDLTNEILENAVILHRTNDQSFINRNYQTSLSPEELAANPEHLNPKAYEILSESRAFPWALPWDYWVKEASIYLDHLNTGLHKIREVFYFDEDHRKSLLQDREIAQAVLGLHDVNARLIFGRDSFSPPQWFGYRDSNSLEANNSVYNWMKRMGMWQIDFPEPKQGRFQLFKEIIYSNFVRRTDQEANVTSPTLFINPEDPCGLDRTKVISHYADEVERIGRFEKMRWLLDWTPHELDLALTTFSYMGNYYPDQKLMLKLSHVVRLQQKFPLAVEEMLSWWGNMDTFRYEVGNEEFEELYQDQRSLYERTFLDKLVINPRERDVFELNQGRTELKNVSAIAQPISIVSYSSTVLAGLKISEEELQWVLKISDPSMNLESLSQLHRIVSMSRAMGMSIEQFVRLYELSGINPFDQKHTENTLLFVELFEEIHQSRFSIEDLDYIFRHQVTTESENEQLDQKLEELINELRTGLLKIEADFELPENPQLSRLLTLIFTPELTRHLTEALFPSLLKVNNEIKETENSLTEPELEEERQGELQEAMEEAIVQQTRLVDELQSNLQEIFQAPNLEAQLQPLKSSLNFQELEDALWPILQEYLEQAYTKRHHSLIRTRLSEAFGIDGVLVQRLLEEDHILSDEAGLPLINSLKALVKTGLTGQYYKERRRVPREPNHDSLYQTRVDQQIDFNWEQGEAIPGIGKDQFVIRWTGLLQAQHTETYTLFTYASDGIRLNMAPLDQPSAPTLINQWVKRSATEDQVEIELKAGKWYRLQLDYLEDLEEARVHLYWRSPSTPKTLIPAQQMLPDKQIFSTAKAALSKIQKTAFLLNRFGADVEEANYLQRNKSAFAEFDFNDLPIKIQQQAPAFFRQWKALHCFFAWRDQFPNQREAFITFLNLPQLEKLKALTGWEDEMLVDYVDLVVPNDKKTGLGNNLSSQEEARKVIERHIIPDPCALWHLYQTLDYTYGLGAKLSELEEVLGVFKSDIAEKTAASIRVKELVKAQYSREEWLKVAKPLRDVLREKQRNALVNYLLSFYRKVEANGQMRIEPVPLNSNLQPLDSSADLYAVFLLDTEMAPCRMSSRIKQGISSIQQFVQRSLMNLEPDFVLNEAETRQWNQWRKNYRVWEANRKVFLYPENWIEPELRDNKSPFFQEMENELMQNELEPQWAEAALKNYLDKMHKVSNLEIMGTTEEETINGRVVHVFGRTRQQPHEWFYRRQQHNSWSPWEAVTVDIQGDHIVPFARNGQLKLFWMSFQERQEIVVVEEEEEEVKFLEVRPNLSEYMNGRWTPKRTAKQDQFLTAKIENKSYVRFQTQYNSEKSTVELQAFAYHYQEFFQGEEQTRYEWNNHVINVYFNELIRQFTFNVVLTTETKVVIVSFTFLGFGLVFFLVLLGIANTIANFITLESRILESIIPWGDQFNNFRSDARAELIDGLRAGRLDESLETLKASTEAFFFTIIPQVEEKINVFFDTIHLALRDDPNIRSIINSEINELKSGLEFEEIKFTNTWTDTFFENIGSFVDNTCNGEILKNDGSESDAIREDPRLDFEEIGVLPDGMRMASNPDYLIFALYDLNQSSNLMVSSGDALPLLLEAPKPYYAVTDPNWDSTRSSTFFQERNESFLVKRTFRWNDRDSFKFINFRHPFTCQLINRFERHGLPGLLSNSNQRMEGHLDFISYRPWTVVSETLSQHKMEFDLHQPFSIYNWELFFHAPFHIATRLSEDQRFEEAHEWFHYLFNPLNAGRQPSTNDPASKHWLFLPFEREGTPVTIQQLLQEIDEETVAEWEANPFQPHRIARLRPSAYMKAVVMKYLDNLIAWADALFRRDAIESINEATQLYIMAMELLGRKPERIVHQDTGIFPLSYAELKAVHQELDNFSNAFLSIEDLIADDMGSTSDDSPLSDPGLNILPGFYFCIPHNEKLLAYWTTIEDRLFKIRHCMNIEGVVRQLPLFQPPIDPGLLVRAAALGVNLGNVLSNLYAPLPAYRFSFMLQKSIEWCNEVRQIGGALSTALEKKDAEQLALLRSTQEVNLQKAIRQIREQQILEVEENLAAMDRSLEMARKRFKYYQSRTYKNARENRQIEKMNEAQTWQQAAQVTNMLAGILRLIPETTAGIGAGVTFGGANLGHATHIIGQMFDFMAGLRNHEASLAGIHGGFDRRRDDWEFQKDLAISEQAQIEKQIAANEIRLQMAQKELANHELQVSQSEEVNAFLKDKFTNEQLYNWMTSQLSSLYFQMYKMAFDFAKQTEKAFQFELARPNMHFIEFGYWDSLKKGLLSGEKLLYDLRRMERAYLENNKRLHELTVHVSLRLLAPEQLLKLREKGECEWTIPEVILNMSYPGQYRRMIKVIRLTIPCVTGPYVNVAARLTLLGSKMRLEPQIDQPLVAVPHQRYTSIATSTANNDGGVFELNFRDERYLPFEGAGADETSWRLELPRQLRTFDYDTISDVILHISFTAKEDGRLRQEVETEIDDMVNAIAQRGLARYISLKNEFPDAFYQLKQLPNSENSIQLTLDHSVFPYFVKEKSLQLEAFHHSSGDSLSLSPSTLQPETNVKLTISQDKIMDEDVAILVWYKVS